MRSTIKVMVFWIGVGLLINGLAMCRRQKPIYDPSAKTVYWAGE